MIQRNLEVSHFFALWTKVIPNVSLSTKMPLHTLFPIPSEEPRTMTPLRRLRLVVFDLDYTIWQPEMYQLNGTPKLTPISSLGKLTDSVLQEARTNQDGKILVDQSQTPITVFEAA
jgi:hypothetical protein